MVTLISAVSFLVGMNFNISTSSIVPYQQLDDSPILSIAENHNDAVLVIAAVPIDERHIVSLWTALECFVVGSANHVVISSPYWARPIMNPLLQEVRKSIPHFASGDVQIEARFFENERYDVGL